MSSRQIQSIRSLLRKTGGELIVGKNTITRKAISLRLSAPKEGEDSYEFRKSIYTPMPQLEKLLPLIKDRVALIFTDEPVAKLKEQIESETVAQRAKVGTISPCEVTIPKGPTGLDPSEISFFHALKISTKIFKQQIEITQDFTVLLEGQVVARSQAVLLEKLDKKPFFYGMNVVSVYDDGYVLSPDVFSMKPSDWAMKFREAVSNVASISLEVGYPTEASIAHSMTTGFKNIIALCMEVGYTFPKLEEMQSAGAKQAATKDAGVTEEAAPVVEEKEAEVDLGGGGMFGDESSSEDGSDSDE